MFDAILITGGAGFIGQNLTHRLVDRKTRAKIVVLDALTYAANPTSLEEHIRNGAITFAHGDITDLDFVRKLFVDYRFDAVMHLAAESHVDRSIAAPDKFIETNIFGTHNLLKCALSEWANHDRLHRCRFLHVSTDEVYGDLEPDERPFTERSPYRPNSPYSASKAASDHLVRAYGRTYGMPVLVTNCSNNYGAFQHPEKLIPLVTIHALEGKPLPIYGDGSNIRDWLHVEDHCYALEQILTKGRCGATYAVGGGSERTNKAVVTAICEAVDNIFSTNPTLARQYPKCPAVSGLSCTSLIAYVADRPGHDRRYAIDATAVQKELGVAPGRSFEDGLRETVLWYVQNESWWRQAISSNFQSWVEENYGHRISVAAY